MAAPLEKPVTVTSGKQRFTLSAKDAGLNADVDAMVDEAVDASREGSIFTRSWRDLTGGEEDTAIAPRVTYSKAAANKLVARVAENVDRPAKDAKLEFPSLAQVDSQDGLRVNAEKLRATVATAMTDPDRRVVAAPVEKTKAKVTRAQLAKKYPTLLVVDRGAFQLRLYKDLKLKKSYRIAVGQVGLETPAGLYAIQNKAVNAAWTVPNSAVGGRQAGQVDPRRHAREPAQGALDGHLRRRGHPRHRSGRLAGQRGLARLRAHGHPRRDRALRPGRGQDADLHRVSRLRRRSTRPAPRPIRRPPWRPGGPNDECRACR